MLSFTAPVVPASRRNVTRIRLNATMKRGHDDDDDDDKGQPHMFFFLVFQDENKKYLFRPSPVFFFPFFVSKYLFSRVLDSILLFL